MVDFGLGLGKCDMSSTRSFQLKCSLTDERLTFWRIVWRIFQVRGSQLEVRIQKAYVSWCRFVTQFSSTMQKQ